MICKTDVFELLEGGRFGGFDSLGEWFVEKKRQRKRKRGERFEEKGKDGNRNREKGERGISYSRRKKEKTIIDILREGLSGISRYAVDESIIHIELI